jgi:hypothetical protein
VPAEEELARVVGEGDALGRDLEVDDGRAGQRLVLEEHRHGLLDGLGPGQRLRVQGEQVKDVAGWRRNKTEPTIRQLPPRMLIDRSLLTGTLGEQLLRTAVGRGVEGPGRCLGLG